MSEPIVRVFSSGDLERREDEEGLIEHLLPSVSGVPNISFSRFATYRGTGVPPHYHSANSIAYLVRGRAAFTSGPDLARRFEMKPGDYIVVPKGVIHTEETIGDEIAEFIFVRDEGGGETHYLD